MPSGSWFTAVQHSGCITIFMCLCSAVALLAFDCVALWKLHSALLNAAATCIQPDKVTKTQVLCNSLICPSNGSPYWLCHSPFFSHCYFQIVAQTEHNCKADSFSMPAPSRLITNSLTQNSVSLCSPLWTWTDSSPFWFKNPTVFSIRFTLQIVKSIRYNIQQALFLGVISSFGCENAFPPSSLC